MKKLPIIFIFGILLALFALNIYAPTNVPGCQQINISGVYNITGNIQDVVNASCFVINASNVLLTGNNFNIVGLNSSTANAIETTGNATFNNISIRSIGTISNFSTGIFINNTVNTTVFTVSLINTTSHGVIATNTTRTNLTDVTIYSGNANADGIRLSNADNGFLRNNDISTVSSSASRGIAVLSDSNGNFFNLNLIQSTFLDLIYISNSSWNNLTGNTLSNSRSGGSAISFADTATNNFVYDQILTANSPTDPVLELASGVPGNIFINVNISRGFLNDSSGASARNSLIYNTQHGQIRWDSTNLTNWLPLNVNGTNIIILNNLIGLTDNAGRAALNSSATISFQGLTYSEHPAVLRNGADCLVTGYCVNNSYSGGQLNVSVLGFSNFSTTALLAVPLLNQVVTSTSSGLYEFTSLIPLFVLVIIAALIIGLIRKFKAGV